MPADAFSEISHDCLLKYGTCAEFNTEVLPEVCRHDSAAGRGRAEAKQGAMRVLCVCLMGLGVFLLAGPALAGEALPAQVAGAHCKSGGLGLGETLTVDKTSHTVIGVREIWSRGQHVTFTSAGGWKAADPTVPMAYLYKPAFSR